MATSPYRCSAFTLIEVLIALIIIAIALTAVIRASSHDIKDQYLLRQKTYGLWVAEYALKNQQLKLPLQPKLRMFKQTWRWRAQVQAQNLTIVVRDEKEQPINQLQGARDVR